MDAGAQPATLIARSQRAALIPIKALGLTMVGLVSSGQGIWTLLYPDNLAAVNRGGSLYERFGPTGVGAGMLVMGLAMVVIGVVWARYAWPRRT